jgi:Spy/CpxP family protein refolding chaperone
MMKTKRSKRNLSLLALVLGLAAALPTFAQEPGANSTQAQRPPESQQPAANRDPLEDLQLTGEQRAAIRAIRIANRDEQMAVNQRLRQAQMALEDALDADYPNEALVEQRAKEVGEAQVAAIRMRAVREVRIRRVLTPDQQAKLREIRFKVREAEAIKQRQQRIQNQINQRRPRNGPTQGNGIAPDPSLRRNNLPRRP